MTDASESPLRSGAQSSSPGPTGSDADDDRTRTPRQRPPGRSAPTTLTTALPPAAITAGTALAEFVIEDCIGEGGFGIVYRAHDTLLQRTVAIKEYMPAALAMRGDDGNITLRSERHRETFELGLKSFINEARLLAAFDHPALLKVYRFWEAQGTAYMVMPCYEGVTLKQWLRQCAQAPDEAWWRERLPALLDALALMHRQHCFHRDIAPDNIMLIGPALQPLLLDFGAARRVIGDATQALTVILKPGYAPVEQYAEVAALKQGPWTDVYALCAVLYCSLTGAPPPASVGRMVKDECVPARLCAAAGWSETFLAGIDAGLSIRPQDRPQDMAALGAALGLVPMGAGPAVTPAAVLTTGDRVEPAALPASLPEAPAGETGAPSRGARSGGGQGGAAVGQRQRSRRTVAWAGLVVLLLVSVTGLVIGLRGGDPGGAEPAASAPVSPTAASAALQPAAATGEAAAPASSPAEISAATASGRSAYQPVAALREVLEGADPGIGVEARADQARIVIDRDRLQFRLRSSTGGHVYVLFVGTDGKELQMLFPNAIDADNRLRPQQELLLPRPQWRITAGGPPGMNHVLVMVSAQPRRFDAAGARLREGAALQVFEPDPAAQAWMLSSGTSSVFAGQPTCAGEPGCSGRYGAVLLRIEEVAPGTASAAR